MKIVKYVENVLIESTSNFTSIKFCLTNKVITLTKN